MTPLLALTVVGLALNPTHGFWPGASRQVRALPAARSTRGDNTNDDLLGGLSSDKPSPVPDLGSTGAGADLVGLGGASDFGDITQFSNRDFTAELRAKQQETGDLPLEDDFVPFKLPEGFDEDPSVVLPSTSAPAPAAEASVPLGEDEELANLAELADELGPRWADDENSDVRVDDFGKPEPPAPTTSTRDRDQDDFDPEDDPEFVPFKLPEGFDLELGFASKLAEAKPDAFEGLSSVPAFEPSLFEDEDEEATTPDPDLLGALGGVTPTATADPFDLANVDLDTEYKLPEGFGLDSAKAKDALFVRNGMGCGTLAWGSPQRGFGETFERSDVTAAFKRLMEGGVTFFDSAEVYGHQSMKREMSSEQLLGHCMQHTEYERPVSYRPQVATKYMPILWTNALVGGGFRLGRRAVVASLKASLARLQVDKVSLYQVHFPFPYVGGRSALYEGIARCRDEGLCDAVGVSNFNGRQVEIAHQRLDKLGVNLVTNQVELSLAKQDALYDGTVDRCRELGIDVLAHSPLGNGLCTGRYTTANPSGVTRKRGKATSTSLGADPRAAGRFDRHVLQEFEPLHRALREVANSVRKRVPGSKATQSQVALNWLVSKGMVPLPGVKNVAHADEVIGCLSWALTVDDVAVLDAAACGNNKYLNR